MKMNTILWADDDADDLQMMRDILVRNNRKYSIQEVQNGREALDYLQRADAEANLPCLIILDINMPGMDGFQFLDAFTMLSEIHHRTCRVIMLSTSESFKDLNRANRNRFVRKFLNKPLTAQVIDAIKI